MIFKDMIDTVICGDCLELMKEIPNQSIDMILCDLPYGTTTCKWDTVIPFEPLWEQYKRIIKNNGAIVLTAREPFTSALVISNVKNYKHKWVWNKKQSGSFLNAKYMPLQIEEDIIVFGYSKIKYFPQMRTGKLRIKGGAKKDNGLFIDLGGKYKTFNDQYYPVNIIEFPNCGNKKENQHPTQKPVALFEYLINTYTNKNDLVLDNCAGSGTTGVSCIKTNRRYILIEKELKYCQIARDRLRQTEESLF